jgi:hypothetical protein
MALHHATCLENVPIIYDQSLLKGIVANHYCKGLLVLVLITVMHF